MKRFCKRLILFAVGGCLYYIIEIFWRGYSHLSMAIVGGICFLLIGAINELFTWDMSVIYQGFVGAIVVTTIELIAGLILNIWLNLDIWDYSNMPFNFMGQICLPFSILWIGLSIVAVVLDDWLRYWWFGEEKPYYIII